MNESFEEFPPGPLFTNKSHKERDGAEDKISPSIELAFPDPHTFADVRTLSIRPEEEAHIIELRKNFESASTVYVIAGDFGLGDAIMEIRYALIMAKKSNKQVYCQVPPPLLSFLSGLKKENPNVHFVEKISPAVTSDRAAFFIKFGITGIGAGNLKDFFEVQNFDAYALDQLLQQIKTLLTENRLAFDVFFEEPLKESNAENVYKTFLANKKFLAQTDIKIWISYCLLGIPITIDDVETNPLFSIESEEMAEIPQDLDLIILPDAKESETIDSSRSTKSLDLRIWDQYFTKLKEKGVIKLGIVRGVSHPDYCDEIIRLAREKGFYPEVIQGNLQTVAKNLLRTKKIIGMDSGTTHLALDVKRFALKHGRNIEISSLFNFEFGQGFYESYGIINAPTFLFKSSIRDTEIDHLLDFMISHS